MADNSRSVQPPPRPLQRPSRWSATLAIAPPILVALGLLVLLAAAVGVDPAPGVTVSTSPFTDEGWNVVNARNLVLLGSWSADDWKMQLVNLPFSLLEAAFFAVAGVGIVQARLVAIFATVAAVLALGLGLRRPLGLWPAALSAAALGASALVLYYGRLAFLEPVVMLFLVLGLLSLVTGRPTWLKGIVAGVALALAVMTKASAIFAVGGMLLGVGLVAWRDPAMWRSLASAIAAMFVVALGWVILVALPQPAALALDLRIWAPEPIAQSVGELVRRIASYATRSDGAIPLALPLLVAGAAGLAVSLAGWTHLTPQRRRLLACCLGWFVAGMGVLLVVPYRPNRYLVPLLPPLAVLAGLGLVVGYEAVRPARRRLAAAGGLAAAAFLILPGPWLYAGWVTSTPTTLPAIQAKVAALVSPGSAVQGDLAPLVAMRVPGPTLVSRPNDAVNAGDLYATRGVRWVLTADPPPAWAALHPDAWNARSSLLCFPWGPGVSCLYRLP